jgi:putative sigma-54 modulation protein
MKPTIIVKGVSLGRTLRDHIARRLQFALNRVQHDIQFINVRIDDQNGPKGDVDKRCQIHLVLAGLPDVVVTEKAVNIVAAVDQAVRRTVIAVHRLGGRLKTVSHAKYRMPSLVPVLI